VADFAAEEPTNYDNKTNERYERQTATPEFQAPATAPARAGVSVDSRQAGARWWCACAAAPAPAGTA